MIKNFQSCLVICLFIYWLIWTMVCSRRRYLGLDVYHAQRYSLRGILWTLWKLLLKNDQTTRYSDSFLFLPSQNWWRYWERCNPFLELFITIYDIMLSDERWSCKNKHILTSAVLLNLDLGFNLANPIF